LRKLFVSLTYDFLLIARNSQARRKSGVSAPLSQVWRKILCKSGPSCTTMKRCHSSNINR